MTARGPAFGHRPNVRAVLEDRGFARYCRDCGDSIAHCSACGRDACDGSLMVVMEPDGGEVGPCCADRYDAEGYRKADGGGR